MDKKLNEVTKVTDMAYVPVIIADGSIGQIAKSDLASVVAGMLGNPVGTKGYIENVYPNISSYDEVVSSGIYTVSDSVSVSPKNGVLVVNASSAVVCQTFYEQNGVNQSRLRWYGNWTDWQRIDNFGCNSLAELSAGVAGILSKSYVDNLNEELINGSCGMYSGDTTNRPPTTDTYGVWYTHKAIYASGSGLFLIQVAMPQIGTEVWMRICWNNNWKEWKKLG